MAAISPGSLAWWLTLPLAGQSTAILSRTGTRTSKKLKNLPTCSYLVPVLVLVLVLVKRIIF